MPRRKKVGFQRKYFFGAWSIGLACGLIMYGTVRGLVMSDTIPRDVPFLKKLFITQLGEFSSPHIVDLDEHGIKFYNIPSTDPLLRAPAGQFTFNSLLNGNSFAIGSIHSEDISSGTLELSDFGIPMVNYINSMFTGTCAGGGILQGIINSTPNCVMIAAANTACPNGGTLQGRTSTGLLLCTGFGALTGQSSSSNGELWHESPTTGSIFYGTRADDNNGNVGVGETDPLVKLHVKDMGTGSIIATPSIFILTGGSSSLIPKPCPYNSAIAITSTSCVRQHGICGSANGASFGYAPTSNLCTLGNPSTVVGNGPWYWTCLGVNGGNNSPTCSAVKTNNGICGSANGGAAVWDAPTSNLCNGGTPTAVVGNEWGIGANYSWSCQGSNGGSTASCGVNRIVHGKCINRDPFGNNNPVGLNVTASLNSKAACQGVKWFNPYLFVLNYSNVVGNGSSAVVTYTSKGINAGHQSGQCETRKTQYTTYSICGSAEGQTFTSTPSSNLCYWSPGGSTVNGSTSAVSVVNGPGSYQWYKWTCQQYGTISGIGRSQQTCYARKQ